MINIFTLPVITLLLLLIQALFAGSEIALLSCDKAKIRSRADSGSSSAKLVMNSINKIEEYVSTSLVGENLCIVINTVILSFYVQRNYPQYDPHLISVIVLTPLIVIFGQVVPKSVFQKQSTALVLRTIYFSIFLNFSSRNSKSSKKALMIFCVLRFRLDFLYSYSDLFMCNPKPKPKT